MSIVNRDELYKELSEAEPVEMPNDMYTPEDFEFEEEADMPADIETPAEDTYLETFRLQGALLNELKNNRGRGFLTTSLSVFAFVGLGIINTVLFIFGLFCIVLETGFIPITPEEAFKKC